MLKVVKRAVRMTLPVHGYKPLFALLAAAVLLAGAATRLDAGSRLGRITGVMGEVVAVNLGREQGLFQGLRGNVFKFDSLRNTVDVAEIQIISVSASQSLAKVMTRRDSLEVGQFVDIEGTMPQSPLEKVDILRVMEESARNFFAARQYTEPDSANCLALCRKILAREPNNRLATQLIARMTQNYFQWGDRERYDGNFANAIIYYMRLLKIDPGNRTAYEHIWEVLDMIDAESEVPLDPIQRGRPPDFYYASAEQYYRSGQFEKSKKYFSFLLDNVVQKDMVAREGLTRNDRMLTLLDSLRTVQHSMAQEEAQAEQERQATLQKRRERTQLARYWRAVGDDLFRKKDYEGALVYYLKLLDYFPDDSLVQQRRELISRIDMAVIPAGEFSRGSNTRELSAVMNEFGFKGILYREMPKRWVFLDSFYLDRTEVTNRQYMRFLESSGHSPPLHWKDGKYPEGQDNYPVVYVSWLDASEYARWVGKRLPSEEEWEKAARGKDGLQWPWGDQFQGERANTREAGRGGVIPVGSLLGGASAQGILDLAGNVWEWVSSDLKPYPGYDQDMMYFPSSLRKVIRGGSFKETGEYARGAYRGDGALDQIYNNVGFRCARDLHLKAENLE